MRKQQPSNSTKPKQKFLDTQFDQNDYNHSMLKALNHYNLEVDSNIKQEWVLEYFKNNDLNTNKLSKLPASLFDQLGVLIRLKNIGIKLIEPHERYITSKHYQLWTLANNTLSEKQETNYKKLIKESPEPIQNNESLEKLLTIFEDLFDKVLLEKIKIPDLGKLITEHNLNKNQYQLIKIECKLLLDKYTSLFNNYDTDTDIKESYQHIKKAGLQRGIFFLESIITECDKTVIKKKIVRQKKNKPAKDIVKKIKYLKTALFTSTLNENIAITLNSFDPKYIIGCKELLIFNANTRKLFVYKSIDDTGLSINGSTLLNFSEENSYCKTIRKPETFFKDHEKLGKRELNNKIKEVKSVMGKVTGRINKYCILLKYY